MYLTSLFHASIGNLKVEPENLLLDLNGVLKVTDFGLSTYAQQEDELLRTACGIPNYVAPEVLNDRGYVGSTSDIWLCGVILFVLMAGYLPFVEPNHAKLYKKIGRAQFTCPSWFSPKAKKLLKLILDPNPLTRIKVPELLKDEWFKKGYKQTTFIMEEDINVDDVAAAFNDSKENLVTERKEKPVSMNAFEHISRSQSFNLENLFEKQQGSVKRETHFTSQRPTNEIMSKIEEVAKPLGFNVHKRNYKHQHCNAHSAGESDLNDYNLRLVLTIAFQFTFENHLRDNVTVMARQHVHNVVRSIQRVAMAIAPSRLSSQLGSKSLPGPPEALTLARWICKSYRFAFFRKSIFVMINVVSSIILYPCLQGYLKLSFRYKLHKFYNLISCVWYDIVKIVSFRLHTWTELFSVESTSGDAILKQVWHHPDAVLCCSVKTDVNHLLPLYNPNLPQFLFIFQNFLVFSPINSIK
ncbi:hypothetical protein JHK82_022407 [Glycine max]|uniref:non-specific serine/threonine protein kinase n=1 Tax=Glycine max TaxID=3847 RepID=A0A0R0IS44_SOYBN|nr:hypothetical protein JHK85_022890 [Glycine max]KAG5026508.1 hypothetical protein JHK86_022422 [Glycine max]KAG5137676.1 hypothetical protein JHK82_022407 [Glycine max]